MKSTEEILSYCEEGCEHFEKLLSQIESDANFDKNHPFYAYQSGAADALLTLYRFITGKTHKYSSEATGREAH